MAAVGKNGTVSIVSVMVGCGTTLLRKNERRGVFGGVSRESASENLGRGCLPPSSTYSPRASNLRIMRAFSQLMLTNYIEDSE
jgi:hypothetical protein